ncbi:MAG TPA: restriction endonuclease subunit S [Bacillota bacterium]|nr:restriction endonuclease subunit S [Bacillota bacterium]
MKVREGYKNTEVGVIPEDWEFNRIEEICQVKGGKRLPQGYQLTNYDTGQPYIRVSDMFMGGVNTSELQFVPIEVIDTIKYYRISKNDLFISVAGTLGLVGQIPDKLDNANLTENADKLCDIKCNKVYLLYCLMTDRIQSLIKNTSTLGAQPKLALTRIQKFALSIPPIHEQQAIAAALSDVDCLICSLSKLINKKKSIKQGVMQELLTGKKRLDGFSGEWKNYELRELLDYEQPTNYIVKCTEYLDKGIPVLTAGKSFVLGYTNEKDGVLMKVPVIIFDDFTTDSKYVTFPFKVKSSAMKILNLKNQSNSLRLIFELMQMIDFPLTDHQRYWISEYSKLVIKLPSEAEEQTAIANILSDMDAEIEALEQKLNKYNAIKQGMMQELLTGRIRLI